MKVTKEDIQAISRLVDDLCGIVLDESKDYLIESRLSDIAVKAGCATFTELYYKARYKENHELQREIVNAITTRETLFFRDNAPFDALQFKLLPELIDAKAKSAQPKRFRIWSAACSSGQEPYSIAITFLEMLPDIARWDINILATDISDDAIRQASLGRFAQHEIQRGLKPELLAKYFTPDARYFKIKDQVRSMVQYRQLNLHEPFTGLGPFDIIFCRNVAIYFKPAAKKDIFTRLADKLTPNGLLFVGSTESLTDLGPKFIPESHCRAAFYRPNRAAVTV